MTPSTQDARATGLVELAERGFAEALPIAEEAAKAWIAFKVARGLMNISRPAANATPAERSLYAERYQADHAAEREHHRTAIRLAQVSPSLLIALRALAASTKDQNDDG